MSGCCPYYHVLCISGVLFWLGWGPVVNDVKTGKAWVLDATTIIINVSTANHYNLLCRYIYCYSLNQIQSQRARNILMLGGTWFAAVSCRCRARGGAATRRWAKWCRISWTTPYPSAVVLRPQLWTPMHNVILSQGLILYVDGRWVGNQLSAASELRCEVRVSVARPRTGGRGHYSNNNIM